MSKHTEGPWRYEAKRDNFPGMDQSYVAGSVMGGQWHIARIWNDLPEAEANARLIAAAPDLLEALRDLLAVAQQAIASGDWKVDGACDPDTAFLRARTVIAKATEAQP